jgi:SAM-dependent methyltransferase
MKSQAIAGVTQDEIDARNSRFWNELCGTQLAQSLGITTQDAEAIDRFDRAYLDMYPYLLDCVPTADFSGKKVLEIGLGYGTLSQQIVLHATQYRGLDIAQGPVDMSNVRMERLGLPMERFKAVQGSMLECPFESEEFDVVVSIGCFHHTGNLQRCIDETWRVLKPGGRAFIMVYNKFSYRNWMRWPVTSLRAAFQGATAGRSRAERASYDANTQGEAAPETVFSSVADLRHMFSQYASFLANKRNCGVPASFATIRRIALPLVGPLVGLDIYVTAMK